MSPGQQTQSNIYVDTSKMGPRERMVRVYDVGEWVAWGGRTVLGFDSSPPVHALRGGSGNTRTRSARKLPGSRDGGCGEPSHASNQWLPGSVTVRPNLGTPACMGSPTQPADKRHDLVTAVQSTHSPTGTLRGPHLRACSSSSSTSRTRRTRTPGQGPAFPFLPPPFLRAW